MIRCDDPFAVAVRARGFDLLDEPNAQLRPLTVLESVDGELTVSGHLARLVPLRAPLLVGSRRIDDLPTRTGSIAAEAALPLVSALLRQVDGHHDWEAPPGVTSVSFAVGGLSWSFVRLHELTNRLSRGRFGRLRFPPDLHALVITDVLAATSCTVELHGTDGTEVLVLEAAEPVTFATRCTSFYMGLPLAPGGVHLVRTAPRLGDRPTTTRLVSRAVRSTRGTRGPAASPPESPPTLPTPQQSATTGRRVGVGFASQASPAEHIDDEEALRPDARYWLWCEIGAVVQGAIGGGLPLAASVPAVADLDVVVFTNEGGVTLEHKRGVLRLDGGDARVLTAGGKPARVAPEVAKRRLFFGAQTPAEEGRQQLRVHLYHRTLLVQAFDVTFDVRHGAALAPMDVKNDYALSHELAPDHLASLGAQTLSVFANASPDGTHSFRFFSGGDAGEPFAHSARLGESEVQSLLDAARGALHKVAWGTTGPWNSDQYSYRYGKNGTPDFVADLFELAKCGYRMWDGLIDRIGGDATALRDRMASPGTVQLGLKDGSSLLLPLAMVYDHCLETDATDTSRFSICPQYTTTPDACLDGVCPHRDDPWTICPSGFWGFRHSIGVPLGAEDASAAAAVPPGQLRLLASVYDGQRYRLKRLEAHLAALGDLVGASRLGVERTREDAISAFARGGFQVLYFYCHGGVDPDGQVPYLLLGTDREDPNRLSRAALRNVRWQAPRSLVVMNGCHTAAMDPRQTLDLARGFVASARAAGVVGTEITVFEELAVAMGEGLVKRLLEGSDIGRALRDTRRQVLRGPRRNPLGLAYVAFALPALTLEAPAA